MAIIKAMVKIKAFEEALSVATEIKSSFHKFSVLKDIATAMSQAGMPEEKVVGVFEQALSIDIKFSSSDLFLLKEMATAIAEANIKKGEKSRLFNKMSILTSKTHNIYQSDAKAIVAVAMAQAGLFEEAFAVTGEIVGWHAIPRALSGIAAAIAKAEIEKEEKIKLFKRGVAVAKNIKIEYKLRLLANSLAGIAAAMAQAGLPMKEVHSIFEEALIAANKADASPPPVENILIKMGEAGHINQAIRLMNKIKNRSVRAKKIVRLVIAINGDQPPQTDSNMIKSQLHTRIYAVLGMAEE
jgi:hypothetical protein